MIVYILMLITVGVVAELLSMRRALDGVEYEQRLSKALAEPEERIQLISILTNRKRRFLSFIRLEEKVPTGLWSERELTIENYTERRSLLTGSVYLMPRQRLTRRTTIAMGKRGRYLFTGATLYGGDFLGLRETPRHYPSECELVILPKKAETRAIRELLGGTLGDASVNRFIHEDPMLTLGFHEYTGREPMKQISWPQSARMGRLMVRTFDHTVEKRVTLILNADTYAFGSYGEGLLERCYALTRGICEALEAQRVPFGIFTNVVCEGKRAETSEVNDGLGRPHLAVVLELLGRAGYGRGERAETLIERAARRAEPGRRFVFITPVKEDLHKPWLERLKRASGTDVVTVVAAEGCE